MKQLFLILLLFPLFGFSQNRFKPVFSEADSMFMKVAKEEAIKAARETDSIFNNCIHYIYFSSTTEKDIIISEKNYLDEYTNGYLAGQLSFYYHKDFNYDLLERKLKKIKKQIKKARCN